MKKIALLILLLFVFCIGYSQPKPKGQLFEKKIIPVIIKSVSIVALSSAYNVMKKDTPAIAAGVAVIGITATIRIK